MGFLDHSTNNIIVDAVLTDLGRKRLSQNDGSFSIVKFALGDDEIDYSKLTKGDLRKLKAQGKIKSIYFLLKRLL